MTLNDLDQLSNFFPYMKWSDLHASSKSMYVVTAVLPVAID